MPILHSASLAAFHQNLKRELAAGKPKKQALAIAYEVQRRTKQAQNRKERSLRPVPR